MALKNISYAFQNEDNRGSLGEPLQNASITGYGWCNTPHTDSMGRRKSNSFFCHYHGVKFQHVFLGLLS